MFQKWVAGGSASDSIGVGFSSASERIWKEMVSNTPHNQAGRIS